jgi:serine/threonine protein kinase/Tfp pilus assembly protein PilF
MLGKTLGGRYHVLKRLGGGGFGQTFLAEDCHLPGNPHCVVKQLKVKVDNPEAWQAALRLFDREAEVLYRLGSHSQIPQLFAHFKENHEFYLVQEAVQGTVLSQELCQELAQRDRYTESDVAALLIDILSVLTFVHEHQVIHRDIKPSNLIRRAADGKIVLIDFGAVKEISTYTLPTDTTDTTFTIAIGSSGYMPNEQLAGRPRFSSDIYAVGMVGIQMLTGLAPNQLEYDPKTGELLWQKGFSASSPLINIVDRMVRYDYRQRYQVVEEALQALRSFQLDALDEDTVHLPPLRSPISLDTNLPDILTPHRAIPDNYLVWLERGDELFQQQRYEKATECYDRILQAFPDDPILWFKRGLSLEHLQRYEDAIAAYIRVARLQPQDYLAWFKKGKVLEQLKRHKEALSAYESVIRLQPENYWAWHDRACILEKLEQFEEAVESYTQAIQIKPDFQLAIEGRKRILRRLKQVDQLYHLEHYEEAIHSCDQQIQSDPSNALVWLMRGMALENSQHPQEAIASYKRVVQLQPDDHLAWLKLGNLLESLNQYQSAEKVYAKVIQLQPHNYWAWCDRGRVLEALNQHEAAISAYSRALQIQPSLAPALEGHARAVEHLKQT